MCLPLRDADEQVQVGLDAREEFVGLPRARRVWVVHAVVLIRPWVAAGEFRAAPIGDRSDEESVAPGTDTGGGSPGGSRRRKARF